MMRVTLQSESQECGLACLVMVAAAHGLHLDLATLRRRFAVSIKGTSLAQLIRYAQSLEFTCRPLRLELDDSSASHALYLALEPEPLCCVDKGSVRSSCDSRPGVRTSSVVAGRSLSKLHRGGS